MSAPTYSRDHVWYAAANIDVPAALAQQALEDGFFVLPVGTRVDVLDLRCHQCQGWYEQVRGMVCSAATGGTAHLRGGPGPNVRRKRLCPRHHQPWAMCDHLHDEPHHFGRPPMPAVING